MWVLLTYFHKTLSLVEESLLFVHINGKLKVHPIFLYFKIKIMII